jgi:hypothetical protein
MKKIILLAAALSISMLFGCTSQQIQYGIRAIAQQPQQNARQGQQPWRQYENQRRQCQSRLEQGQQNLFRLNDQCQSRPSRQCEIRLNNERKRLSQLLWQCQQLGQPQDRYYPNQPLNQNYPQMGNYPMERVPNNFPGQSGYRTCGQVDIGGWTDENGYHPTMEYRCQ